MAAEGGEIRQITGGPYDDADPQWSPDGRTLTFLSDRAAKGRHQLYALDGELPAEARPIAALPGSVEWHRWTADGTRILAGVAGGAAEQADALGSGTLGAEADLPAWIPEVESSDDAEAERRSLWVVDVVTGASRQASRPGTNVWEAAPCGPGAVVAVALGGSGRGRVVPRASRDRSIWRPETSGRSCPATCSSAGRPGRRRGRTPP